MTDNQRQSESKEFAKGCVLIVDDEEDFLRIMNDRLTSWGYKVFTAPNGKEAIGLIKCQSLDMVILDIMMPQMDGITTLRQIRKFDKKLPVFMLTAHGDEGELEITDRLGISGFIHKAKGSIEVSEAVRIALQGIVKK